MVRFLLEFISHYNLRFQYFFILPFSPNPLAKRKARQRYRKELEEAGVLEPVEDDNSKVASYHFHDISAA